MTPRQRILTLAEKLARAKNPFDIEGYLLQIKNEAATAYERVRSNNNQSLDPHYNRMVENVRP